MAAETRWTQLRCLIEQMMQPGKGQHILSGKTKTPKGNRATSKRRPQEPAAKRMAGDVGSRSYKGVIGVRKGQQAQLQVHEAQQSLLTSSNLATHMRTHSATARSARGSLAAAQRTLSRQ